MALRATVSDAGFGGRRSGRLRGVLLGRLRRLSGFFTEECAKAGASREAVLLGSIEVLGGGRLGDHG